MIPADWTRVREARLPYSYERFAQAKAFVFDQWCALARERAQARPIDLSGACRYGSLFMQATFGGAIRGHFAHQYNLIGGRLVDLGHDALDVGRMSQPYLHEETYFSLPELQDSLRGCTPRAEHWSGEFLRRHAG